MRVILPSGDTVCRRPAASALLASQREDSRFKRFLQSVSIGRLLLPARPRTILLANYGASVQRSYLLSAKSGRATGRTGIQPHQPAPAEAARPRALGQSPSPRQSEHREILRRVDP